MHALGGRLRLLLVPALLLGPAALAGEGALTSALPEGLPSAATLEAWERIDGHVESGGDVVTYRMWVNPARPAVYEITQYRIADVAGPAGRGQSEKVLWNREPGSRKPLLCFERTAAGWRQMVPGTDEFRGEMMTAIRVYGLHREARARQR